MDLTISVTDASKLTGLQRATAAYNLMNPTSVKTDAEFLQWTIDNQLDEYARTLTRPYITNLEFMDRFNSTEWEAIQAARNISADVAFNFARFERADGITLTDPRTIAGVNALEAAGLIATGRAAIILAL